jgi:ankyrin repeat protein
MGAGQSEWGANYRKIFDLIVWYRNRNRNLHNAKGQIALLSAVGWGRLEAVDALLRIGGVDPNIPSVERITPLIAAIGNMRISQEVRNAIVFRLLDDTRTNPNQQGLKNLTPILAAIYSGNDEITLRLINDPRTDLNSQEKADVTPLILAIVEGNVKIALQLTNNPRVNVNQRGPDNKLPLQIAFEAGLAPQLANPICWRSLKDYDVTVKKLMREMLQLTVSPLPNRNEGGRLLPDQAEDITNELLNLNVHNPRNFVQEVREHIDEVLNRRLKINVRQAIAPHTFGVLLDIVALWNDPRVNVDNYAACQLNQLVNAIREKIHYLSTQLAAKINLGDFGPQLWRIDANTQLLDNYLTQPNERNLRQLFLRLQ